MLHIDTKKLARIGRPGHRIHGDRRTRVYGIGWGYAHVAIDDHARLAYAKVLRDEGEYHDRLSAACTEWYLPAASKPSAS